MLLIATKISGNMVYTNSPAVGAAWQGWFNDSRSIIVEIPYFCFNDTKFVFNILIKVFVITYELSSALPPITIVSVPDVIDL